LLCADLRTPILVARLRRATGCCSSNGAFHIWRILHFLLLGVSYGYAVVARKCKIRSNLKEGNDVASLPAVLIFRRLNGIFDGNGHCHGWITAKSLFARLGALSLSGRKGVYRLNYKSLPQHFLYFLPLPHGHGSLRPILPGTAFLPVSLGASTVSSEPAFSSPPCSAVPTGEILLFGGS